MLVFDRLPTAGPCVAHRPPGHPPHVLDLVGVSGGTHRRVEGSLARTLVSMDVEHFHGWKRRVVAPTAGAVVTVHDVEPDRPTVSLLRDAPRVLLVAPLRSGRDVAAMAGNYVVLETAGGFVLLAHLRRGSVAVRAGETVAPGDPLGEVGLSGNSLAPHLHVQVMSAADPLAAAVLPWEVRALRRYDDDAWAPAAGPLPLRVPVRSP